MTTLVITTIDSLLMVLCFSFIGSSLKYIDQVYDEGLFKKEIATLFSITTGILMGFLISFDSFAAILLIAIIIGVALTKKLDNFAHLTAATFAILVPVFILLDPVSNHMVHIMLLPLGMLILSGILDELLDAVGDRQKIWLLTTRPTLKLTTFFFASFGIFGWTYFFSMLAFDISYIFTGWYSYTVAAKNTNLGKYSTKREIFRGHFINQ